MNPSNRPASRDRRRPSSRIRPSEKTRSKHSLPSQMTIVEVGPRDGLQNEKATAHTKTKIEFINRLAAAGLPVVEATSFVNPKWVPQLADAGEVMGGIEKAKGVRYPVLVPNEIGLDRALKAGVTDIAVFVSATETFSQKNLNATREEVLDGLERVCKRATDNGLTVRGYLSMVLGDPWEGRVDATQVLEPGLRLLDMGCAELALSDTIGTGTPSRVQDLIGGFISSGVPVAVIAVHFHDTYGQALCNVLAAMELGVTTVDSSAAGLGGCPFSQSATGNLATEDLVWMLDGLGIHTGVDVEKVARAGVWMCGQLGIPVPGRAARALTQ